MGQIFRYLVKPWNPDELLATVREACLRYDLIIQNRRLTRDLIAVNSELEARVEARTAELAAANVHLRNLNHLKDEFLAITSHDLRSPLASIQMTAQMLMDDSYGLSADEQREMAQNIYNAARHLIALVSNLLDLAKMEAGKLELDRAELRLSEVAARSIEALAFNARAKHITIELAASPAEPVMSGDNLKLYRVFNNLLSNAIKFTPEGGRITVAIAPEAAGVSARITDTGLGIPPADLPKLFGKFQQMRKTGTQGEKGTGLGLAIVKELVELHGGRIEVESEVGRGTTFITHLPILNEASSPQEAGYERARIN
jgi:signal transduction histidine kinase